MQSKKLLISELIITFMAGNTNEKQAFLNRLTEITEANLSNEQFGVSELAREMRMSRSYIHRRLKSITNQSISQFICTVRLERAMEMLQQKEASAAEIAHEAGFSSLGIKFLSNSIFK